MVNKDLYLRLIVVIMAMLQPVIILWVCGFDIPSISSSWQTILQPLYIITNAMTSFFFFGINKWRIPAILLLMLTAFSVDFTPIFHNIIAGIFFLSCVYPLSHIRRLKHYVPLYFMSIFIWFCFGLFWFETWGIYVLCIYHLNLIWYRIKIEKSCNNKNK
jgi:hypothetical protein